MNSSVAIPKLFLRGNRWYVRVQVPTSMQDVLKRKEYWVALKTADRSVALENAADAAHKKRRAIVAEYHELVGGRTAAGDHDIDPFIPTVSEDNSLGVVKHGTTVSEITSQTKQINYDRLKKSELIALLEQHDQTKKLGLVWERNSDGDKGVKNHDLILADLDAELSCQTAPWDNLVIEGNNYDALRWLRATRRNQVKCIYIDPPYNTGNTEWAYNDRYKNSDDRFDQSMWLEFLYKRFELARDLLTDDGVILVSINDENRAALELLMRDVLPKMRIGSLVWRTRNGSNTHQGGYLSSDHEHILIASKKGFAFNGIERSYASYSNPDNDPRGDWQPVPIRLGYSRHERPNLYYPVHDPKTNIYYPCNPDSVWRFASRERITNSQHIQTQPMEDFIEQGRIKFPSDQRIKCFDTLEDLKAAIDDREVPLSHGVPMLRHDLPDLSFWVGKRIGYGTPIRKLFKTELKRATKPLSSWISGLSEPDADDNDDDTIHIKAGSYTEGSQDITRIFGSKVFNYAKPVSLIRELLRQSTSDDDLVLDFFAGSATTAQAVMKLNSEDRGKRKFIMVSSTEATMDEPHKNLCRDVTAERIRLLNGSDHRRYAKLSAGFAYLRTKQIKIDNIDHDLTPSSAWNFLEALHGLPLTTYDPDLPWNVHEDDNVAVVLVDRFEQALIDWLQDRSGKNAHLYAWAKGPLTQQLEMLNIQVKLVTNTVKDASGSNGTK